MPQPPPNAYGPDAPTLPGMPEVPRCRNCDRRLAEYLTVPYSLKCPRCGTPNVKD